MNSQYLNEDGNAICVVCKKIGRGDKMTLCPGCENFAHDSCGTFTHKASSWLCKNCQPKPKEKK